MAWNMIREITEDDHAVLNERAEAFSARHGVGMADPQDDPHAWRTLEHMIDMSQDDRLRRLWLGVFRRAVGSRRAEGVAYGYIGYHVD